MKKGILKTVLVGTIEGGKRRERKRFQLVRDIKRVEKNKRTCIEQGTAVVFGTCQLAQNHGMMMIF